MFAGGFDKGAQTAYLVTSANDGRTWSDISPSGDAITLMAERADGHVLLAVSDGKRQTLGEIVLTTKHRSVTH
jgi:hypothetical protein